MTGTKQHPQDIFGGSLKQGDTIVYIQHGRLKQGFADGFTAFGVRVIDEYGEKVGTVLRDRVAGPASVSRERFTTN